MYFVVFFLDLVIILCFIVFRFDFIGLKFKSLRSKDVRCVFKGFLEKFSFVRKLFIGFFVVCLSFV